MGFPVSSANFHPALEKLGASSVAFRTVVGLDLEEGKVIPFRERQAVPPVIQAVHDEVAGLRRTAEGEVQLPAVFVHQPERCVFFLTAHIMVDGLVVTPGLPATGIFADLHAGLAVHAQTLGLAPLNPVPVLFLEVGEDGVRFRDFFWGLALTTERSR